MDSSLQGRQADYIDIYQLRRSIFARASATPAGGIVHRADSLLPPLRDMPTPDRQAVSIPQKNRISVLAFATIDAIMQISVQTKSGYNKT